MEHTQHSRRWIGVGIIAMVVVMGFIFSFREKEKRLPGGVAQLQNKKIENTPLFQGGLAAAGIEADTIGFHDFSPDEHFFLFTTLTDDAPGESSAFLLSLKTGTVAALPGMPERGVDDSRVITLLRDGSLVLYFPTSEKTTTYEVGENLLFGSLSPDGKTYVINTTEGIKKIAIATGAIASVAPGAFDGAYAWFSDNNRMLGVKETPEQLGDGAGNARIFGVWDIRFGTFTPIETSLTAKTFRSIEWVVPDTIARINTGFDDGSHDYLINLATGELVDLGDTSGALLGGAKADPQRNLFALVGGEGLGLAGQRAVLYRGMEKIRDVKLEDGYLRQQMHIVDTDRLVYLRERFSNDGSAERALVLLLLASGEEKVLRALPADGYAALSFAPEQGTWVLSQGDAFFTGSF